MVPKYVEGWGGTRGNTPGMDIHTVEEEIVPKIGYWYASSCDVTRIEG